MSAHGAAGTITIVLAAALLGAQQPARFRGATDLVRLPVIVLDRAGDPIGHLAASDFEVFENGRRQVITAFAEGAPGAEVPLHLGLMLDRSRSMETDLPAASNAAVRFVTRLTEADDVTFVDFDEGVRVGRFSPPSYPQLFERIRDNKVGRGTALYDALERYATSARDRDGQHVLLIYSDGGDSVNHLTLDEMMTALYRGDVIVYVIGYLNNQGPSARPVLERVLSRVSSETGGNAFFPGSDKDLDRIYGRILAEIQGRYTLGYVPADAGRDGKFRKVEVRLVGEDLKHATVRTRSGYLPFGATGSRP